MTETEHKPLSEDEARSLTKQIIKGIDGLEKLIIKAFRGRVWEPMGYESWDDWCEEELPVGYVRIENQARIKLTEKLTYEGEMSSYAIASGLGVSQSAIKRDLAKIKESRGDSPDDGTVVGRDGKRQPRRKATQAPELVDRGEEDDETPEPMSQTISEAVTKQPESKAEPKPKATPKAPAPKAPNESLPILSRALTKVSSAVTEAVSKKSGLLDEDIEELKRISGLASDIQCAIEAVLLAEEATETAATSVPETAE